MKKLLRYFLLPAVIITSNAACFLNFYKATPVSSVNNTGRATTLDSLKLKNKDFIVRAGKDALYMSNLKLSDDQQLLSGRLDSLVATHMLHLTNGRGHNMRYKKGQDEEVLSEVHLYLSGSNHIQPGDYTLKLSDIQKIEIIQKDRGRTVSNHVLSTVGVSLVTVVIAAAIIVALSSCPYVSAYNGHSFTLQGEAYSGAIYPQLARDDYMPLRMQPTANGLLQLKISNELKEKQNTDLAELWVVAHNKQTEVLTDENGNLYGISHPEPPLTAILSNGQEATRSVLQQNDDRLLYFDDTAATSMGNYVVMNFNKPAAANKATLILSLKNSFWLDYLYGEMIRGLGTYYKTYIQQQSKKTAADLIKWSKDQQMPLEVSVKTADGWKKINDVSILGPAIARKIAIPVDLTGINSKYTSVKLSSGFFFWEIDYAAIDYSNDSHLAVTKLLPVAATDQNGKDVLHPLTQPDEVYLEQPVAGNTAMVDFSYTAPADTATMNSYILHTKGYYTHTREFTNKPDIGFLQQFKNPGALSGFSLALYKKLRDQALNTYTKK